MKKVLITLISPTFIFLLKYGIFPEGDNTNKNI